MFRLLRSFHIPILRRLRSSHKNYFVICFLGISIIALSAMGMLQFNHNKDAEAHLDVGGAPHPPGKSKHSAERLKRQLPEKPGINANATIAKADNDRHKGHKQSKDKKAHQVKVQPLKKPEKPAEVKTHGKMEPKSKRGKPEKQAAKHANKTKPVGVVKPQQKAAAKSNIKNVKTEKGRKAA